MAWHELIILSIILILHLIYSLDKMVTKAYSTRPDAGCAMIHERRIERFSWFAEVKAEYKKKDTLSIHQDLLRLAMFGMNEIDDNNTKCILLVQVIGKVNPKPILYFSYFAYKCIYGRHFYNVLWIHGACKRAESYVWNFKNQNPVIHARFTGICHETGWLKKTKSILWPLLRQKMQHNQQNEKETFHWKCWS